MLMWRFEIGFVLSTMLIILLVLSMFVLTASEIALLQIKVSNNFIMHDEVFWLAEQGLRDVERLVREQPTQVDLFASGHRVVNYNDQDWWDGYAAKINMASNDTEKTQYLVEQIKMDPCLQLAGYSQPGAIFFRITVRAVLTVVHASSMVQSICAAPATNTSNAGACQKDRKFVQLISAGRQSWREIL